MTRIFNIILLALAGFTLFLLYGGPSGAMVVGETIKTEKPENAAVAVFAGGCFWCLESEFRALNGVVFTRVGYIGGTAETADYAAVSSSETTHAEAVEVSYDPAVISYEELVRFFLLKGHDPTQLNRQGVDIGPQYRSALYPANDQETVIVKKVIAEVDVQKTYVNPVVTKIEPLGPFYEAEAYHQQYYEKYQQQTGKPHIRVLLKKQHLIKDVK